MIFIVRKSDKKSFGFLKLMAENNAKIQKKSSIYQEYLVFLVVFFMLSYQKTVTDKNYLNVNILSLYNDCHFKTMQNITVKNN